MEVSIYHLLGVELISFVLPPPGRNLSRNRQLSWAPRMQWRWVQSGIAQDLMALTYLEFIIISLFKWPHGFVWKWWIPQNGYLIEKIIKTRWMQRAFPSWNLKVKISRAPPKHPAVLKHEHKFKQSISVYHPKYRMIIGMEVHWFIFFMPIQIHWPSKMTRVVFSKPGKPTWM